LGNLQPELFSFEAASKEMNGIQTIAISDAEVNKILAIEEGHFTDVKAIETSPAGVTKAIASLSNAEGGELFIGVDERGTAKKRSWRGFPSQESANAHVQVFEQLFPLGSDYANRFFLIDESANLEDANGQTLCSKICFNQLRSATTLRLCSVAHRPLVA